MSSNVFPSLTLPSTGGVLSTFTPLEAATTLFPASFVALTVTKYISVWFKLKPVIIPLRATPTLIKALTSHFSGAVPTHISYLVILQLGSINGDQLAKTSFSDICNAASFLCVEPSYTLPAIGAVASSMNWLDTASLNNPTLLWARSMTT